MKFKAIIFLNEKNNGFLQLMELTYYPVNIANYGAVFLSKRKDAKEVISSSTS
jgi:hypothetical protein